MTDLPATPRKIRLDVGNGITLEASIQLKISGAIVPRPRPPRRVADLVVVLGETADGSPVEANVRFELTE